VFGLAIGVRDVPYWCRVATSRRQSPCKPCGDLEDPDYVPKETVGFLHEGRYLNLSLVV
jgi:hypothetical protein